MDTSKPSLKVRSLDLGRVPGQFTTMMTTKQMFSKGTKNTRRFHAVPAAQRPCEPHLAPK